MSQSELTLREIRPSDADFIYSLASDARVTAFVGDGQPWSEEFTMKRLNQAVQDEHIYWLLALVNRIPIGLFVASDTGSGVEIGYWVRPENWGQGVAGRMLNAGLPLVADRFPETDLLARVHEQNTASLKLLERRGFRRGHTDDQRIMTLHRAAQPRA
ncbi:GNAT family N-acetyltransferase [Glutamicibacter sp. PS]|uniref:GNAT family N-acetyltransferase n=1 Tax=Glutamicibacter sp. PS TaxID=3075634 RepID=UPI0028516E3C|nr:GNAT family N-acetyltransferase [Glutamicibacter sp. PS]MDR4533316.1 GNAT family N-acetyltransferase [Glutamicibacter sp. PS]